MGKMLPICSGRSLPRSNCLLICQPSFDLLSFGMIKMLEMLQLHVSALSSSSPQNTEMTVHKSLLLPCFQQTLTSKLFSWGWCWSCGQPLRSIWTDSHHVQWHMDALLPRGCSMAVGPHMTDTALGER